MSEYVLIKVSAVLVSKDLLSFNNRGYLSKTFGRKGGGGCRRNVDDLGSVVNRTSTNDFCFAYRSMFRSPTPPPPPYTGVRITIYLRFGRFL